VQVQRCRGGTEVVLSKKCRCLSGGCAGGCACSEVLQMFSRGAEVQQRQCSRAGTEVRGAADMGLQRCRGAEVQRCRDVNVRLNNAVSCEADC
jgi:hypothetical protein